MNENRHAPLDELLSSATEALRDTPSEKLPAELASSTIDRIYAMESGSRLPTAPAAAFQRGRKPSHVFRYTAVAAAFVLLAIFAVWWMVVDRTASPSFAQMIEEVAKATSVTFVSQTEVRSERTDEEVRKEDLKWHIQGEKIRMEEIDGTIAVIADGQRQTFSRLERKLKKATVEPLVEEIAEQFADPVSQIQRLNAEDAQLIGEEQLDGRAVQLYQLDKVAFLFVRGRGQMKIWVDPQTRLPVKILLDPTRKGVSTGDTQISDFEWNKKLDESLFQIPADYDIVDAGQWLRRNRR